MSAFRPRCFSSMPQARPVGPAPTMIASSVSTSEHALDGGVNVLERRWKRRNVLAAGLGHIGATAALAAHRLRDLADQFSGMYLRREVFRHGADDGDIR